MPLGWPKATGTPSPALTKTDPIAAAPQHREGIPISTQHTKGFDMKDGWDGWVQSGDKLFYQDPETKQIESFPMDGHLMMPIDEDQAKIDQVILEICAQRGSFISSVIALSDGSFWIPNCGGDTNMGGIHLSPDGDQTFLSGYWEPDPAAEDPSDPDNDVFTSPLNHFADQGILPAGKWEDLRK